MTALPPPRPKGCHPSTPSKLGAFRTLSVDDVAQRLGLSFVPTNDMDVSSFTPRLTTVAGRKGSLDQNPTESCTGHSKGAGLFTACAAQGVPLDAVPSPDLLYKVARSLARAAAVGPNGSLPALVDGGAEFADVANGEAEYGVVPMGPPPPDGRYSDVDPATVNDNIDLPTLEKAGYSLTTGPYRLATGPGSNVIASVKACLAAKIPLWVAFYCDRAYEALQKGQVAQAPVVSNQPGEGGHAVYLSAGEMTSEGLVALCEGSWGDGFCDGGACLVSEAWIEAAWEIWPIYIQMIGPRRALGRAAAL